eukprot:503607-Amphidinium_carterae.1
MNADSKALRSRRLIGRARLRRDTREPQPRVQNRLLFNDTLNYPVAGVSLGPTGNTNKFCRLTHPRHRVRMFLAVTQQLREVSRVASHRRRVWCDRVPEEWDVAQTLPVVRAMRAPAHAIATHCTRPEPEEAMQAASSTLTSMLMSVAWSMPTRAHGPKRNNML